MAGHVAPCRANCHGYCHGFSRESSGFGRSFHVFIQPKVQLSAQLEFASACQGCRLPAQKVLWHTPPRFSLDQQKIRFQVDQLYPIIQFLHGSSCFFCAVSPILLPSLPSPGLRQVRRRFCMACIEPRLDVLSVPKGGAHCGRRTALDQELTKYSLLVR